jgi:hypothetical protein
MLLCLTGTADARPTADQALAVSVDGPATVDATGISCRDDGGDCVELYTDGATDSSESYTANRSVRLTASPSSGATFAGWDEDCGASSTTCSLVMSTSKAVTASFNQAPTRKPGASEPASMTFTRAVTQPGAIFAAHSLGRPLVARTPSGWAVTLRFFTSRSATGLVRLSLNGKLVGEFTFSPPRGGVRVGPFKIARRGAYRFQLTLSDPGGAVARLTWNLAV